MRDGEDAGRDFAARLTLSNGSSPRRSVGSEATTGMKSCGQENDTTMSDGTIRAGNSRAGRHLGWPPAEAARWRLRLHRPGVDLVQNPAPGWPRAACAWPLGTVCWSARDPPCRLPVQTPATGRGGSPVARSGALGIGGNRGGARRSRPGDASAHSLVRKRHGVSGAPRPKWCFTQTREVRAEIGRAHV